MKNLIRYSIIFILAFSSLSFQQLQNYDTNSKVKAAFLYNFTKYFDWPDKMKSGNFIIQIVGSNANLSQELNKMAATKQVGTQKLEIKITSALDPSLKPHMIYLLNESSDLLKDASSKYKGNGTLIITEKSGMAKAGAAINFVVAENKQRFEYSENNAKKAGLKTGDGLNGLAIAVD
ncbi:MAG: hypothetical protein K0S53_268 [Bacteroidetes bacterium]|nr:hypothetical protein [Bacteroidota bacterium]